MIEKKRRNNRLRKTSNLRYDYKWLAAGYRYRCDNFRRLHHTNVRNGWKMDSPVRENFATDTSECEWFRPKTDANSQRGAGRKAKAIVFTMFYIFLSFCVYAYFVRAECIRRRDTHSASVVRDFLFHLFFFLFNIAIILNPRYSHLHVADSAMPAYKSYQKVWLSIKTWRRCDPRTIRSLSSVKNTFQISPRDIFRMKLFVCVWVKVYFARVRSSSTTLSAKWRQVTGYTSRYNYS